jgi:ubiquinone/menaquinone biosynthesis C-methylase UbiE
MKVLDVATGTGLVAREALALAGSEGSCSASIPAPACSPKLVDSSPSPSFAAAGRNLPLRDASFDFVSMGFALRHVTDLDALFAEFRRVLKPGGIACVLEISRPRPRIVAQPLRVFMTRVVPAVARLARRHSEARRLMDFYWDTIDACVPPEEVLASLVRSGFAAPKRLLSLGCSPSTSRVRTKIGDRPLFRQARHVEHEIVVCPPPFSPRFPRGVRRDRRHGGASRTLGSVPRGLHVLQPPLRPRLDQRRELEHVPDDPRGRAHQGDVVRLEPRERRDRRQEFPHRPGLRAR